jgi:hypothetical protein
MNLPTGATLNIPFPEYLRLPGLSVSTLKHLLRSPLNYKWHQEHPNLESTPSQAMGTAAHTAILEPAKMKTDYALWEGGTRRGKEWDAFKADNATKTILTVDEFADIREMRRNMVNFEPAARYLKEGAAEVTLQWRMEGRAFRGRVDWLTTIDGSTVLVDLKTTKDARPFKFGADAYRFGYHLQFALYCDGWHALTGENPGFVVLAVENQPPFEPAVFEVPDEVLERGREEYQRLVHILNECESANHWPPAAEAEQRLALPSYAYENEDNDLTDLGLTA